MKTKFRFKIKVNDIDINSVVDYKTGEIQFSDTKSKYHFTQDEKVEIQKKVKKILKQEAEKKFKR